jgi:hypothetical protein
VSTSTIISNFRSHASPIRIHNSLLLLLPCCYIWLSGPGSHDMGFKTSIDRITPFGSQDLGFRTSTFGSQDLGRQKLSILGSSTGARSYVLSFSHHFSLRPVVTNRCVPSLFSASNGHRRTHRLSDFIYSINLAHAR